MTTHADPNWQGVHWQEADSLAQLVDEGRDVRLVPVPPRPRQAVEHAQATFDVPDRARSLLTGMPGYGS